MTTLGYLLKKQPEVEALLRSQGLTAEAAKEKAVLFEKAARHLLDASSSSTLAPSGGAQTQQQQSKVYSVSTECHCYWVPGRIEVVGKHTDYAGGRSLLCAISRGFACVAVDNDRSAVGMLSEYSGKLHKSTLEISPDLEPQAHHWTNYPATVIRRLARNFGITKGSDISIQCDLPESSGMSSSSAMICSMWMVLSDRNSIMETELYKKHLSTNEELYAYLGFIENGQDAPGLPGDKGVGTFGGSEDHTAIMACERGTLKMFSYCPTKFLGEFTFPEHLTFVVAVSGAIAEKTGGAMADYNNACFLAFDAGRAWCRARKEAGETIPAPWNKREANLAEIVRHVAGELGVAASHPAVRKAILDKIDPFDDGANYGPPQTSAQQSSDTVFYAKGALCRRFSQFFYESECIIEETAKAFAAAHVSKLRVLVDWSHELTVSGLRNTIPATEFLPSSARKLGAISASAFGAGFGGSCWALVPKQQANAFLGLWQEAYHQEMPQWKDRSNFFIMAPCNGSFHLGSIALT